MATRRFVVTADGVELIGELVIPPNGPAMPAALILNGSGPLDRDSNMPEQVLDVASTFASALAASGVTSLRFDKRGVGESGGNYLTMGLHRETADAAAALAALRDAQEIDPQRVVVIGHSVGSLASRVHDVCTGRRQSRDSLPRPRCHGTEGHPGGR